MKRIVGIFGALLFSTTVLFSAPAVSVDSSASQTTVKTPSVSVTSTSNISSSKTDNKNIEDDLPPVPFIVGGDEALSPAKSADADMLPISFPPGGNDVEEPQTANASAATTENENLMLPPLQFDNNQSSDAAAANTLGENNSAVSSNASNVPAVTVAKTPGVMPEDFENPLPFSLPPMNTEVPTPLPAAVAQQQESAVNTSTPSAGLVSVDQAQASAASSAPTSATLLPAVENTGAFTGYPQNTPDISLTSTTSTSASAVTSSGLLPQVPQAPIAPIVAQSPVQAAPAAMAPPIPMVDFQENKVSTVIATDGSQQIKGLERTLGGQNTLLPAISASPSIAAIGDSFPALHVDQISLEDLLGYIKDYTPKTIRYQLSQPLYVTLDLKARSVEEVMLALAARYPIDVSADANTIYVRPLEGKIITKTANIADTSAINLGSNVTHGSISDPINSTPANVAQSSAMNAPVNAPLANQPVVGDSYDKSNCFPAPVMNASTSVQPAYSTITAPTTHAYIAPASNRYNNADWEQVRLKARLYELNRERQKLLAEREEIRAKERKYKVNRGSN